MTAKTYSEVWDLDVFFQGGSSSPELITHLNDVAENLSTLKVTIEDFQMPTAVENATSIKRSLW